MAVFLTSVAGIYHDRYLYLKNGNIKSIYRVGSFIISESDKPSDISEYLENRQFPDVMILISRKENILRHITVRGGKLYADILYHMLSKDGDDLEWADLESEYAGLFYDSRGNPAGENIVGRTKESLNSPLNNGVYAAVRVVANAKFPFLAKSVKIRKNGVMGAKMGIWNPE